MTLTLHFSGELEAQLARDAMSHGVSPEKYVLDAALRELGLKSKNGGPVANAGFGKPSFDPYLEAAGRNAKAAAEEAVRLGITDSKGRRIRTDLPEDMREGAERDFGG